MTACFVPNIGLRIHFKHDLSHELDQSGAPSGKSFCSEDLGGCIILVAEVRRKKTELRDRLYELLTETKGAQFERALVINVSLHKEMSPHYNRI